MKKDRMIYTLGIIGLAVTIFMLFFSSPTEIGPLGVLVFFTAIYILFFAVSTALAKIFLKLALGRSEFRDKDYLSSAVFAFTPIMLLMMRSFGAIDIWTIVLIVIFIALAEFLVAKRL